MRMRAVVRNPAQLREVVGSYAPGDARAADIAVSTAEGAFPAWSRLPARQRADVLVSVAADVAENIEAFALLLTREHGKILAESTLELHATVGALRYFASLSEYVDRDLESLDHRGRVVYRRAAMGVVAVIAPWNWPVVLAMQMCAPALMAGNTVVVKLPDNAPLTLRAVLGRLQALLPPGVLNIVAGSGRQVGSVLTRHPAVRKVSFTGSTKTGRTIMRDASVNLKNLSLELGGNDPALILEGATIDETLVDELARATFMTSGQVCYAPKRLYVHRRHYQTFVDAFTARLDGFIIGNGLDPVVTMGPLNNKRQLSTVQDLLGASRAAGARVVEGGHYRGVDKSDGWFMLPTVVTGIEQASALVQQEQFGPAVPVLAFDSEDEAVWLANDSEYGLAASIWSDDRDHAFSLARRIDAGSVFVNIHRVGASDVSMPFGGFKQSGIGRGHGEHAVDEATELQVIAERTDMRTR